MSTYTTGFLGLCGFNKRLFVPSAQTASFAMLVMLDDKDAELGYNNDHISKYTIVISF